MTETRKLAAILVADIAGYSRLAGADEDRIRWRASERCAAISSTPLSPPVTAASSSGPAKARSRIDHRAEERDGFP